MKFLIITLIIVLANANLFCQGLEVKERLLLTKKYQSFIPKNYMVLDTALGDYNTDQLQDLILVVQSHKDTSETYNDMSRGIIILRNTGKIFIKELENLKAMYCQGCGGIYGDPYVVIELQNNILKLYNYGGSAIRWSYNQTFRYQNNQWNLIGLTYLSYRSNGCIEDCDVSMCELQEQDFNVSTKKMHFIETENGNCKPKKDYWKKIKNFPKTTLKMFDVNKDYFKLIK